VLHQFVFEHVMPDSIKSIAKVKLETSTALPSYLRVTYLLIETCPSGWSGVFFPFKNHNHLIVLHMFASKPDYLLDQLPR